MQIKIQDIHNGKLFGILSETGCSGGTANALMNESGSSHTVDFSIQPYNKNREVERYGDQAETSGVGIHPLWERSVSLGYIDRVLEIEKTNMNEQDNFVFASSWQLDGICHGWIGLYLKETNTKHYLHYTLPEFPTREYTPPPFPTRLSKLEHIAKIGVELLHSATYDATLRSFKLKSEEIYPAVLDMAYFLNDTLACADGELVDYDLVIGSLEACPGDYPVVFEGKGMIRLEDLARRSNQQVIVKGSFNPMHHAHKDMADMTKTMYPGSVASLLISTVRYDKPHIGTDELIDRIHFINEHDYPLIVVKEVYFYDTFKLMTSWMPDHKFYWPLGTDTVERIHACDIKTADREGVLTGNAYIRYVLIDKFCEDKKHFFVYFKRGNKLDDRIIHTYGDMLIEAKDYVDTGVSSTKIRSGEMSNDIDQE